MSRAKCRKCKTIIESTSIHDFVVCKCKKNGIFLDGGYAYCRYGGKTLEWVKFKGKRQKMEVKK